MKKKFISSAQRIFTAHLSWFHKCQLKNKEAHFRELYEDGGLADFSKNLLRLSFIDNLSNEPNFNL